MRLKFFLTCAGSSQGWGHSSRFLWASDVQCPPGGCSQNLCKQESPPQTYHQKNRPHSFTYVGAHQVYSVRGLLWRTCFAGWSSHTLCEDRWLWRQMTSPCGSSPLPAVVRWRFQSIPGGSPSWKLESCSELIKLKLTLKKNKWPIFTNCVTSEGKWLYWFLCRDLRLNTIASEK